MDSFDDFLRNELSRVKLDEYDTVARLKLAAEKKIAATGKSAMHQGVANLKTMVQKLVEGFKTYCGEQEIDIRDARLEDFVEYVRVTFGVSEENFDRLAYGAHAGKSKHAAEVAEAAKQLNIALHDNAAVSAAMLQKFEDIAEEDKASEMAVRKVLWQLYRRYPSRANALRVLHKWIGCDFSAQKLYQTATAVAKVLLKKSVAQTVPGADDAEDTAGEDAPTLDPTEMDEGEVKANTESDLRAGFTSDAFDNLMKLTKLKRLQFEKLGSDVAKAIANGDKSTEANLVDVVNRRFTKEECIRFTRMMLEFFHRDPDKLQLITDLADETTKPRLEAAFSSAMRIIRKGVAKGSYDATEVNKLLSSIIRDEKAASKLFVLTAYATYAKFTA